MAKQVTRKMADNAAKAMAAKAFDEKIKKAEEEQKAYGDKLISKYVPAPIIAACNEFPLFFSAKRCFNCTNANSTRRYGESAHIPTNVVNPGGYNVYVPISEADFKQIEVLNDKVTILLQDKRDTESRISDALVVLRTEKRIKEQFPEALDYLCFSETSALVPQYEELRSLFK